MEGSISSIEGEILMFAHHIILDGTSIHATSNATLTLLEMNGTLMSTGDRLNMTSSFGSVIFQSSNRSDILSTVSANFSTTVYISAAEGVELSSVAASTYGTYSHMLIWILACPTIWFWMYLKLRKGTCVQM